MTPPLNVSEVAAILRASERYVLDELRANNLRGTKLGGRAGWRITEADLEVYLNAKANVSSVRRAS